MSAGCVDFRVLMLRNFLLTSPGEIRGGAGVGKNAGKFLRLRGGSWLQMSAKCLFTDSAITEGSFDIPSISMVFEVAFPQLCF